MLLFDTDRSAAHLAREVVVLPSIESALQPILYTAAAQMFACALTELKNLDPDGEHQLSYMNRDSQNFKKGLTVTTFYLAKGLEFDQVFGVFAADAEDGLSKQAKYIAATRALHELHMYDYKKL